MPDVFQQTPSTVKGVFRAGAALLNMGEVALALVQSCQVSYQRPITRLFDLAEDFTQYYVLGRPEGQGSIGRVLGPAGNITAFYERYGDGCNTNAGLTINFKASTCNNSGSTNFNLSGVTLMGVNWQVGAQDSLVSENSNFMFAGMSYGGGGIAAGAAGGVAGGAGAL